MTGLLTGEELLALPDDGMERWLIRGQLRERPMSFRNRWHGRVQARIAQLLGNWLDEQPPPRGEILGGDAGFRLYRDPDTVVGIDVAYIPAAVVAQDSDETTLINGCPILAVEILSPSDREEEINEKVDEYLAAGVALVWLVDTHFETIQVHQRGAAPVLYNVDQVISAEPHLPRFSVPVAKIFAR